MVQLTPVSQRSIEGSPGGDGFEIQTLPFIRASLPWYEELWKQLIWDITGRDIERGKSAELSIRPDCPAHFQALAEAHYTFLSSYVSMAAIAQVPTVPYARECTIGKRFDMCYQRDRFLYFYIHAGRLADMVTMMLDQIGIELGQAPFPDTNEKRDDSLKSMLQAYDLTTFRDQFFSWRAQIKAYRSLTHKPATARIWTTAPNGEYRQLIVKHDKVDDLERWSTVFGLAGELYSPLHSID